MIDLKNGFHVTQIEKVKSASYFNDNLSTRHLFKFKDRNKISYHIIVDQYSNNVHFVKFYRRKHENMKGAKKYQHRNDNPKQEFTRIIATCINVCLKLKSKNEDAVFAFYGQWDNKDILKGKTKSQRISIYSRSLKSICNDENYEIASNDIFNYICLIPKEIYNVGVETQLFSDFYNWFGDESFIELRIPNKNKLTA